MPKPADRRAHGNLRLIRQIDVAVRAADIWVCSARQLMIFFLHHVSIQPRQTRSLKRRKNRSCGEAFAAGAMRHSIRIGDFESTFLQIFAEIEQRTADKKRTLGIDDDADILRLNKDIAISGAIDRSILYCRPEQPPPITATRNAPCGRPCFSRRENNLREAFSVTLMRRSLPIL